MIKSVLSYCQKNACGWVSNILNNQTLFLLLHQIWKSWSYMVVYNVSAQISDILWKETAPPLSPPFIFHVLYFVSWLTSRVIFWFTSCFCLTWFPPISFRFWKQNLGWKRKREVCSLWDILKHNRVVMWTEQTRTGREKQKGEARPGHSVENTLLPSSSFKQERRVIK